MNRIRHSITGFSLVELMIALTLGLTMIAAALSFAISHNSSWQINDSLARIQENGAAALEILAADIQLAGHHPDAHSAIEVLPASCLTGNLFTPPCTATASKNQSDVLMIQYQVPLSRAWDCSGKQLASGETTIINIFSIRDPDGDGVNTLYCRSFSVNSHRYISNNTPLVNGIDTMRVRYRVLHDSQTYRYSDFSQLTASDIGNISAISISLLVSNGLKHGTGKNRNRHYTLPDNSVLSFSADNHFRQLFEATVALENRR